MGGDDAYVFSATMAPLIRVFFFMACFIGRMLFRNASIAFFSSAEARDAIFQTDGLFTIERASSHVFAVCGVMSSANVRR